MLIFGLRSTSIRDILQGQNDILLHMKLQELMKMYQSNLLGRYHFYNLLLMVETKNSITTFLRLGII